MVLVLVVDVVVVDVVVALAVLVVLVRVLDVLGVVFGGGECRRRGSVCGGDFAVVHDCLLVVVVLRWMGKVLMKDKVESGGWTEQARFICASSERIANLAQTQGMDGMCVSGTGTNQDGKVGNYPGRK
ncbi:hypothetical protein EDD21DRAFT_124167, partial [Dissophora ornata]